MSRKYNDLAERVCELEELAYYLGKSIDALEDRVKKLEPKKERKTKKNEVKE